MCLSKLGIGKNFGDALTYFKKATEKGNALAYCNIGFMCHNGLGVKEDRQVAQTYFDAAVKLGGGQKNIIEWNKKLLKEVLDCSEKNQLIQSQHLILMLANGIK